MFRLAVFLTFSLVAGGNIRAGKTQKLRLCNAYPGPEMFEVILDKADITGAAPLRYKECRDVSNQLKAGDRLDFEADGLARGSFTVGALTQTDTLLVLVFSRQDAIGTSLAFNSHVFVPSKTAQVAVIDTFRGTDEGKLVISEPLKHQASAETVYGENLPFNSAIGVKDGFYEVLLVGKSEEAEVHVPISIADGQNYVVIRSGLDDGKLSLASESAGSGEGESALLQMQKRGGSTGGLMLGQLLAYKRYPQDVFVFPSPEQLEAKERKVEVPKPVEEKSSAFAAPASLVLVTLLAMQ